MGWGLDLTGGCPELAVNAPRLLDSDESYNGYGRSENPTGGEGQNNMSRRRLLFGQRMAQTIDYKRLFTNDRLQTIDYKRLITNDCLQTVDLQTISPS